VRGTGAPCEYEEVARVFGRRRVELHRQAVAARGEAATAFSALEDLARQVYDRVTFAAYVDGGPEGQALLDRIRAVSAAADEVVAGWLTLGDPAGESAAPQAATASAQADQQEAEAYLAVRDRLTQARAAFEQVLIEVGPALGMIEQALAGVPRRVQEARQALRVAEGAVEALRLDGLAPESAEHALLRAQHDAEVLEEGPAVHGIAAILAVADEVVEIAAEARRRAEEFPHQRDDIARRLVSMRSRLEATEEKGSRLERGLAALSHGYVDGCWRDLEQAPEHFQAALDEADDHLEQAQASSRRLAYALALRQLERTRVALTRADEQVRLVMVRLAKLDQLQADPRAPLEPVQFALDEARLLCRSGAGPEPTQRLEAQAARLKAAPHLIEGEHPDYLAYLAELDAIKAEIAGVVTDVRRG
jgi:chromosome segregation ATPase